MGTNCAPRIVNLFLLRYENDFGILLTLFTLRPDIWMIS